MTEELFSTDAYARACEANVIDADGGTHVRSTAEVGRVRMVKTESKGRDFKRMRIELVDR